MLSEPIVRMLFEHGVFTPADTLATAHALMLLALGLPAHVLVKALSPAFFARDDTLTPLLATLTGFAVAIVGGLVLGGVFGAGGIAAGIALGAWSNALALMGRGAATFGFSIDAVARRRLPRIVAAAAGDGRAPVADGEVRAAAGRDRAWHRAGRRCADADIGRNRDLRPASGPVRRDPVERGG